MAPRFFYRGGFYNSPVEIRQLQFNQLRSHLYPRDPYLAAEALESFGEPTPAAYMPSRMLNTRWKTPPFNPDWGSSADSVNRAVDAGVNFDGQLQEASSLPPMLPIREGASSLGADHLPEPNMDPNLDAEPISRGVLPYDRIQLHSSELSALVRETTQNKLSIKEDARTRKAYALEQVGQQINAIGLMVSDGDAEDPWYMRGRNGR